MAVLQTLRTKAAGILIGGLGLALVAFIFSDFFTSGNAFFNKFRDKAFVVNGEVVSTKSYADKIDQWENFQKVMSGQTSLDEFTTLQIREMAYQQTVKEMMLDDQAEALGLAVTPEELSDMVYGATPSPILYQIPFFADQQTGQFSRGVFTAFLNDVAKTTDLTEEILMKKRLWSFIENMLKYQRLEEKYNSLIANSVLVNDNDAKTEFEDKKNISDIAYFMQSYTSIPDSTVQVGADEIKKLYDARKGNYKMDNELRKVSYFIYNVLPSDEDYAEVEKEINHVYEQLLTASDPVSIVNQYSSTQYVDAFVSYDLLGQMFSPEAGTFARSANVGDIHKPVRYGQNYVMYELVDKTVAPDSVRLQLLPLPNGLTAEMQAHLSDSIVGVLKGGKDFAELSNQMNPGYDGGNQWVTELGLSSWGIAKECFAAPKGAVLKLTLQGQPVIVRISDRTAPVTKVKLAAITMPVIVSEKTQNKIDNELNQFVSENGNMENFDKAAEAKGYALISNSLLSPAEMALSQASGTRQVIHWAFNDKVGTVKKFDLSDKRIVAIIKEKIDGDYIPVGDVTPALKAELIRDKKAEKIISDLKAKNLTSLDAYVQSVEGSRQDTVPFVTFQSTGMSVGSEPIFNVYAKDGALNKVTEPLKGERGVYVLNVVNRTEDEKAFDDKQVKETLHQSTYYQLMSQSIEALKQKMNVKDNRIKFW